MVKKYIPNILTFLNLSFGILSIIQVNRKSLWAKNRTILLWKCCRFSPTHWIPPKPYAMFVKYFQFHTSRMRRPDLPLLNWFDFLGLSNYYSQALRKGARLLYVFSFWQQFQVNAGIVFRFLLFLFCYGSYEIHQ